MSRSVPEWVGKTDDEPFPERVRQRILIRFGRRCAMCGVEIVGRFTCDHKIALINGGENRESNGQPLCLKVCTKLKDAADQAEKSKTAAMRKTLYGKARKSRPMNGARASPWKQNMDGTWERRTP